MNVNSKDIRTTSFTTNNSEDSYAQALGEAEKTYEKVEFEPGERIVSVAVGKHKAYPCKVQFILYQQPLIRGNRS